MLNNDFSTHQNNLDYDLCCNGAGQVSNYIIQLKYKFLGLKDIVNHALHFRDKHLIVQELEARVRCLLIPCMYKCINVYMDSEGTDSGVFLLHRG